MKYFKKVRELVKKCFQRNTVDTDSFSLPKLEKSGIYRKQRKKEWEKDFCNHNNFPVALNGKQYTVFTYFKAKEADNEKIVSFIMNGLKHSTDIETLVINTCFVYGLSLTHKVIDEENKILLFFSKK